MRPVSALLLTTFVLTAPLSAEPETPVRPFAELVLRNAKIVTLDDRFGEVQGVAIRAGRILDLGDQNRIGGYIGEETQVIDLQGRLVVPGFIEGHGHFVGLGEAKMSLDLMKVSNWDEVIAMVTQAVAGSRPGDWIVGRGWHQEKWDRPPAHAVEGFPVHDELSAISPDNPVLLTHASGHACFANKKAMDLAGVSGSTADPPGGEILRDEDGRPTGIFNERAQGLISAAQEPMLRRRHQQVDRAIDLAIRECHRKGITSFQDAGSDFATVEALVARARAGKLGVRLWIMIRESNERLATHLKDNIHYRIANDTLTVGGLKRSIDGALGSRGAWLLEPYADQPDSTGLATATIESVTQTAEIAVEHNLQLCVHAIGDRANREVLDLFERTFKAHPERPERRWRIEHAQHLHPDDISRFGALGVIAAMQGIHCTSDAPWVIARLGEQRAREGAYVWQKLMQSGAIVTNGTDAPVEDLDPIASFYATVSRRLPDGSVFYGDQRMSRMEALKSYTINAAYAAFEDDIKGTLSPGKLADLTVLSRDILTIPESEIPRTEVFMTIVGGRIVRWEE